MCPIEIDEKFRRLDRNVIPKNYELTISPDLNTFKFSGQVLISLEIFQSTDRIELHSLMLNLTNIELILEENEVLRPIHTKTAVANDSVIMYFEKTIQVGSAKLAIEFDGAINESSNGFYRTKCLSRDGKVTFAAATQFEAAYARKAFPCFDEPSFKATFDITIVADRSKTVISNMPVKKIVQNEDSATISFETTPVMSTYLVAYVVGDYDFVEAVSEEGTLVRVYTPVGMSHLGQFSLNLSLKALTFFRQLFQIDYPLPKLDLIGLAYVDIEAMENYGLLVFKESLLLIDPDNFSAQNRAESALVVCHEIAHQWFGNLVTMEWWTDLWLNEGFATYIEYTCVNSCFPEWNVWNLYASDHLKRAYDLDSLESSHPIEVPVSSPGDITEIFDSISYCKGSSVLRMLHNYVGADSFTAGLRSYLKNFMFGNATSNDLWNEMDKAAPGMEVKRLMQVWTKKKGYPLVNVSKKIDTETNHTILCLKQSKFSSTGHALDDGVLWNIPISVLIKGQDRSKKALMETKTLEIDIGILSATDWIKLNEQNYGFYLVEYSEDLLKNLVLGIDPAEKFASPLDRYELVNEAFLLTIARKISADNLMNLVWQFREETNCYVWINIINNLEWLSRCLLNQTEMFIKFKRFWRELVEPIRAKIGFQVRPEDSDQEKLLRTNILYALAKLEDHEFEKFAREEFATGKIASDMQIPIFTSVLQNGNGQMVDEFVEMHKRTSTPEEKERIALVLGQVKGHELIQRVLEFAISDEVTLEETVFMIAKVACNSTCQESTQMAWEFIKSNWKLITSRYSESALFGRLLKKVLENFRSADAKKDIEEFFAENKVSYAINSIKQSLEKIESNILFIEHNRKSIEGFLNRRSE